MTYKELVTAGILLAKEEVLETENSQLPEKIQLLVDLRIMRRERSDLREKILKMWMLTRKSSLP
jgi:hypothetical protein